MVPRAILEAALTGATETLFPIMGWAAGLAVVWLLIDAGRGKPRG